MAENDKGDKYEQLRQVIKDAGFNPDDSFKPHLSGTGVTGALYNPQTGGVIGTSGSAPGEFDISNNERRIGDYVQDKQGNWNVAVNSPTDLVNRFVTSSAAPLQGFSIGDLFNAGKAALTSAFGLPSESKNTGEFAGKAVAGQLMNKNPITGTIWAGGNFLESLVDAQDAKVDAYLNQDFNYDLAGEFYEDEKGDLRFRPNYQKMASGGVESGEAVKTLANANIVGANMNGDNKLNITVSPVFAASERYKQALKNIKDTYGNLTVEQANEVVDQDTGKTRLQTIEDYIRSEQSNYLYNAQTIRDIKRKAPNASDKSLNIAADTSKIGYLNSDQLENVKVTIYNRNNQLEEVNAKKYLDSIWNMSKIERNEYMTSLGNKVNSSSISDDEKAIVYAQSMALYAASDTEGSIYKGMYQRDFLDEIGSTPEAFTGLSWNSLLGGTDLDTFRQHELSSGLYSIASTGASIFTLGKATNLLESGIRKVPGLSKVSGLVGETGKEAVASTLEAAEKSGESGIKTLGKIAGKTAGQVGFQLGADAIYDAAKMIPYALSGNSDDYDFLNELKTDFLMDVLVTYGPASFARGMRSGGTKSEYRIAYENTKTGEIEYMRPKDVKDDPNYKELVGQDGSRDSKLVEVTSEELAVRHAKAINSLNDSNAALKVQELIFDKNAAMTKLAVQVRSVSDRYHFHKMLRYAADARQITEDTTAAFLAKANVSSHWEAMRKVFKEVAPHAKDLNKADQNYIKAVTNEIRFLGKNADNKKVQEIIKNFYKPGKTGVSAERAEELNRLIKAMQDVAGDVIDFYVEKGLMTAKAAKELRAQPGYEEGYLPMYMAVDVKGPTGGDIGQDRAMFKKVKDAKALIALDDLDNPLNSLARYINNAMRAVAMNDRALAIREAASIAGVGIHLVEDSGGAMKDIKSLKDFDEGFKKVYTAISINTKKSLPTQKEWQETNDKLVLRSNALKAANKVQELQDESKQLHNENRRLQRQIKKIERGDVIVVDGKDYAKNVTADNTRNIEGYKQFAADHMERVPDTVLDKDVEDFALHVIRPGGDVDMYNSYLRGGDYKDTKDWARQYIDDVEDMYADEIEDLAFQFFPGDAEKIAKESEVDFNEKGYWDTMIKYQGALKDMMADKLLQATKGNYELNDSAIFYRGVSTEGNSVNKGGDFSWLKEGGKFKDDGFGFISLSDVVAKNYASHGSGDKYVLEYHIPAGQRMFYFGGIEKGGGDGGAFVLPAGVTGKIGKISNMGDGVKKVEIFIDSNKKDFSAATKKQYERIFDKININRTLIADNKQQQLMFVDDIKRYTGNLMERAQKAHKGSKIKLDIKSYLDIQVTNELKSAITTDNMVGQVQSVLNRAVQKANPWVDPNVVIQRKAQAAAIKYRNKVAKEAREEVKKNKNAKGINSDKINAAVDRAMDKALEKLTGERKAEVTFIDDEGYATKMLDNYGDSHTIRYLLNGKEQRMVLDGQGSEQLVAEFYAPEFSTPKTTAGKILNKFVKKGNEISQLKRYMTTSADLSRVLPNIMRDWSRGIVSTGGQIVLSPDKYFAELAEKMGYKPEELKVIDNGLMLARQAVNRSTLTSSLQMPSKNRDKAMVRAMTAPDGEGFVRYVYDLKTEGAGKVFSALQDLGESFTRRRAMDMAYYQELSKAQSEGRDLDTSIKRATEAAYFAARESTVNFRRRGVLIEKIAQSVPYLTQKFATLQSFAYTYINDPVGVSNALKTTVSAYTSLIAIALSNEESRRKYFMLTEYDRANNIIIPLDNSMIITLPLDDTIAAFLTPYRRMVESMNGLDPEAFYLCFGDGLMALSPFDLSGFSEGDGFNVVRGLEKLGAEFIPTWAQPIVEMMTGRDLYYGSDLAVDDEYTGAVTGVWDPTAGQMTTRSKNSKLLAQISDNTGIPQWILQNFLSEYGGNVGQYVLNTIDKLGGATKDEQGGKEWIDSVFKPFTGGDSDQASNAFYTLVDGLKQEKVQLQKHLKTLTKRAETAGAEEKAEILNERQKKIKEYGIHVSDALDSYMSAFEITGGLSKKQANQVWYLYKLYDEDDNDKMYWNNSTGDYYTDKAKAWNNKQATSLAAGSGFDQYVQQPVSDYYDSYAEQAFKQTSYGDTYHYIAEIEDIMNDNKINRSEMFKNYNNMTSAQKKQWKAAWNTKVVKALAPYIQKTGIDNVLDQRKVVDYLDEVIFVSNPWNTKQYLKKIFGGK